MFEEHRFFHNERRQHQGDAPGVQPGEGGSMPTPPLQFRSERLPASLPLESTLQFQPYRRLQ